MGLPYGGGIGAIGGTNLGTARGIIDIDTSRAWTATQTMRRIGQDIGNSMTKAGKGVSAFQQNVSTLRGEILALGVVTGGLTTMGIATAAALEEARVQLAGIVGGLEKADTLMEFLRKAAIKAGRPFYEMIVLARQLLPTFEGSTEELEKWIDLVRRTSVLNPREGLVGAAFSVNEMLNSGGSDLISLAERFNMSRTLLRSTIERMGGDMASALDEVLNRMGITQEVADAMGQTFNASFRLAKDAAAQVLAEGFLPLIDEMTPLLIKTSEYLGLLRETQPEILLWTTGFLGAATAAAGLTLVISQLSRAVATLAGLGAGAVLGKLGAIGMGGALGLNLGLHVAKQTGAAIGNKQMEDATLETIRVTFRQLADLVTYGIVKIINSLTMGMAQVGNIFLNTAADVQEGFGKFLYYLGRALPGGDSIAKRGEDLVFESVDTRIQGAELLNKADKQTQENLAWMAEQFRKTMELMQNFQSPPEQEVDTAFQRGENPEKVNQDRLDAIKTWYERIQQIDEDAARERYETTRQYEKQRSETIAQYEQQIAREAEDFARQRLRAEESLARSIASIAEDAIKREQRWQRDLDRKIADMKESSNEKLQQIEEKYHKDRERALRDHRLTILEAAARLDARAILEEQRRFKEREHDLADSYAESTQKEVESLAERIEAEREAHAERVQDARENDQERLQDMKEAFALQQKYEDEDRRIRLQRMAEDHQQQLQQLDRAHNERMQALIAQSIREKIQANQDFMSELEQAGIHNKNWLDLQARRQEESLKLFDIFWDHMSQTIIGTDRPIPGKPKRSFARGGPVSYTGDAMVHGSRNRPEYMLDQNTTSALKRMLGDFSQPELLRAVSGSRGSQMMNLTISEGAIRIEAKDGDSAKDIAKAVRSEMVTLMREISR